MDKDDTRDGEMTETELIALLASLKRESAPEADFESRFVLELRERLARESVCCPARRLLWDHLLQMLANFGPRKLAYGVSTLGLGVLAVGFFALPEEQDFPVAAVPKSPLSRLESSLAALRKNCRQGSAHTCTTIRICEQKRAPYTDAGLASGDFATSFEHVFAPASGDTMSVDMGMGASALDSFPIYTTAAGF